MAESRVSLHGAALSGGFWSLIQVVANKCASLIGTFALMYLLAPGDYATASLALSAQAILCLLPSFTLGDALIARPAEVDKLMGTASRLCAIASLATAVALVAAGPIASSLYHDESLPLAFACVATRPLAELAVFGPHTRLRVSLAFRQLAVIDGAAQLGATAAAVVMAAMGLGWWSLLAPQIAFTVVRAFAYARAAGPAPAAPRWVRADAWPLIRDYSLSGLGQYVHGGLLMLPPLVIGGFASGEEVGLFSMAFTLSASINIVVAVSMGLVLQPIFANMSDDRGRQLAAFSRSCSVIAAVSMPLCICQAAVVGPAIRILLPERWAGAADFAVIMSIGQSFYFAVNPAMSLLKAQGRFAAFLTWQAFQLVLVGALMVVAGIAFPDSPTYAITAVASLYSVVSSPLGVWLCLRGTHGAAARSMLLFARPFTAAALAFVPIWLSMAWLGSNESTWDAARLAVVPLIGVLAYGGFLWILDRGAARELLHLLRLVRARLRPPL